MKITSQFAKGMVCAHCSQTNKTHMWPKYGDSVALYHDLEPSGFYIAMSCSHCKREWYIVWEINPGEAMPLARARKPCESQYYWDGVKRVSVD